MPVLPTPINQVRYLSKYYKLHYDYSKQAHRSADNYLASCLCNVASFHLSILSKIIERVVKAHLSDHITSNNLLNLHQSAYCKHHSTETALLYIHDHRINAIVSCQISCLCLLDLSAAFDTIDHNQYLTHSSIILVRHSRHCSKLV